MYVVIRGKLIRHAGILVESTPGGNVVIQTPGNTLSLTEQETGVLYELLGDILSFESSPA